MIKWRRIRIETPTVREESGRHSPRQSGPGHNNMTATPPVLSAMPPDPAAPKFLVRHGVMRFIGEFVGPPGQAVRRGDAVVVRSERGQEVGEVLCPATPQAV